MRTRLFALLLIMSLSVLPAGTSFAGVSPTGCGVAEEGQIEYDTTASSYKYCNGTSWVFWLTVPPAAGVLNEVLYNDSGNGDPTLGSQNRLVWDSGNDRLGIQDNTPDAELDVIGDIHYTGNLLGTSDIRLKKNIRPLENSLQKLAALHTFSFVMKNDPKGAKELGVSAQEVLRAYPFVVSQDHDGAGTYRVNYIGLIAPLLDAVSQLERRNKNLETKIIALEERIKKINAMQARRQGAH